MNDFDAMSESDLDARLRREGQAWRAAREGCPHPDLLLARGSELLDDELRRRLDAHVAACGACARLAVGFAELQLSEPAHGIEQRVFSRVTRRQAPGWRWLAVAAAVVLVAGATVVWWRTTSTRLTTGPGMARSAPSTRQGAHATGGTSAPVASWTIEAAPVRLPIGSLDASRGTGSEAPGDAAGLIDALAPYQAGDYPAAVERLAKVARARPDSADAAFYLGVACLLANRPADAIGPLDRAGLGATGDRRDAVEWYRAAAEQRTGQPDAARTRLADLCQRAGAFRARACAAQQSLR